MPGAFPNAPYYSVRKKMAWGWGFPLRLFPWSTGSVFPWNVYLLALLLMQHCRASAYFMCCCRFISSSLKRSDGAQLSFYVLQLPALKKTFVSLLKWHTGGWITQNDRTWCSLAQWCIHLFVLRPKSNNCLIPWRPDYQPAVRVPLGVHC